MLTSGERLKREAAIKAYLEAQDHDALTRIVTAERWIAEGEFFAGCGACLVGHALGSAEALGLRSPEDDGDFWPASNAYEALCREQGIGRTVASIQLYAATLLHDREEAGRRMIERATEAANA